MEFHFEDNEYFTNKVLTKTYEFRSEKDKQNPLLSNNNSLYKCLGCKINWNEGKCPLKDDDEDEEGKQGSFFDFFLTHTPDGVRPAFKEATKGDKKNGGADDDLETDEEAEHLFELDYEIGKSFLNCFKAVCNLLIDIKMEYEMRNICSNRFVFASH